MPVEVGNLIDRLYEDSALEHMATVQYAQHIGVLTGIEHDGITEEIKIHVAQKFQNAITLAEQIDYLRGFSGVELLPDKAPQGNRGMLEQDLEGAPDTIARYQRRITQAEELQELALTQKLREVLAVEQEYAVGLRNALGRQLRAGI